MSQIEYVMTNKCGTEVESTRGLWECVMESCDGVHHFFQFSLWKWSNEEVTLW